MHQTHAPRKDDMTIRVEAPRARMPRFKTSGAGSHQDRRLKRQARFQAALRD